MLIKSGKAKLVHESKIRNLILKIVLPGEFLQLPSLFEENLFRFSVISIESTTIWHIEKNVIANIIKTNPEFAVEIIRIINKNKLSIIDRFTSLTQKQAHGKMADLILYLSEHVYGSLNFQMTLSRKDIGELTGMSTETVVRILTEFNNDGLIKMSGKKVELNSLTLLRRLSEVG
jgi:CRP/FNR family transcriptional regulator